MQYVSEPLCRNTGCHISVVGLVPIFPHSKIGYLETRELSNYAMALASRGRSSGCGTGAPVFEKHRMPDSPAPIRGKQALKATQHKYYKKR